MNFILLVIFAAVAGEAFGALPKQYRELLLHVQKAPNQGETNTCLFQASTGAMELLLNKRDGIINPKVGGKNDLSESFLIWQKAWTDRTNPPYHFIEAAVKSFNYGEAVHISAWPFAASHPDGTESLEVWNKHPEFDVLPRLTVPKIKTELLFSRGRKYAVNVLKKEDIETVKKALVERKSPVIVNYNDDSYWHVILIVGYDDEARGHCYQIEKEDCNKRGAFYVRDSNGKKFELRAYNWFLKNGNAAAVIEFK